MTPKELAAKAKEAVSLSSKHLTQTTAMALTCRKAGILASMLMDVLDMVGEDRHVTHKTARAAGAVGSLFDSEECKALEASLADYDETKETYQAIVDLRLARTIYTNNMEDAAKLYEDDLKECYIGAHTLIEELHDFIGMLEDDDDDDDDD